MSTLILRWYFMMLVGILAVYTSQSWLVLVTVLVGVSAVLGYRIGSPVRKPEGKVVRMKKEEKPTHRKAG